MVNLTNPKPLNLSKQNYHEVFTKNFVLGYNVGTATTIANAFPSPALHENALLNRFSNLGIFNGIQDIFFQRTNSDWKTNTDNFFYLGVLQTLKFIPNIVTQNIIKSLLYKSNADTTEIQKITNTFLTVSTGMTVFFSIGAFESKIVNEEQKFKFVLSAYIPSFLGYMLMAPWESQLIKNTKEIHLSLNGFVCTTVGLIGSYVVPDVMHRLGIDKNHIFEADKVWLFKMSINSVVAYTTGFDFELTLLSAIANEGITEPLIYWSNLDQAKLYGYDLLNIASLTIIGATSLDQNTVIDGVTRIAAFSFAKAIAVTGVEIINDNKGYICSNFLLESACEYLGIVEANNEITL